MKIVTERICLSLIGLIIVLFAGSSVVAQETTNGSKRINLDIPERAKILQPSIINQLESGEETVNVIILMKGYEEYVGKIRADKPSEMKLHQAEIRRKQDIVLNRLGRAQFNKRHQFENLLGFSGSTNISGLKALAAMPEVEFIEEDRKVEATLAQGIPLMNGTQVRSNYNGTGVSIAIVDTGIDYTHPMLGGAAFPNTKVIGGYDFGDNDANPLDCEGHGTSVAGIAAGTLASGPGNYIGGVAHNARLYALKIVSGCGNSAYDSTIVSAWNWAVTHRNDDPSNPILIINTSFGGGQYSSACDKLMPTLATAANTAVNNGITLFGASGNNAYTNAINSPACVSNSISVGAVYDANIGGYTWCTSAGCATTCTDSTTAPDQVTCYSNSANILDILAASNAAYTTAVGGDYTTTLPQFGGTSAASPYAAGTGAVLQSYAKTTTGQFYTPTGLRARLINAGDPITDAKNGITKPRVNILASFQAGKIGYSPTSYNFGDVNVGNSLPKTFTVSNTGTANLTIGTATVTGTNPSDFSKNSDTCSGQTLSPSGSCSIQVLFAPATGGVKNAELNIPSNDPDTPTASIPLSGTGLLTLTVTKSGTGSGSVTSTPAGINCGSDCFEAYNLNTSVTLTATPSTDSSFAGWSGACSGTGNCVLTMDANKTVTATFNILPPVANFSGSPTTGYAPFNVNFTDLSINSPTSWSWNFGDGGISTLKNPSHVYISPGTYTVSLTATNSSGSDIETKTDYITVESCSLLPVRIGSTYYSTLQEAYNAATDQAVIQSQGIDFTENVTANRNISVTLQGGYDCNYTTWVRDTNLKGMITTSAGTLTIGNFILQQ